MEENLKTARENFAQQSQFMADMKTLVEGQQKLAETLLEIQKAAVRRLEVTPPLHNSTHTNSEENINLDTEFNNSVIQRSFLGELNQTFTNLRQSLDAKSNNTNLNIKRDYKLTQKVALNVWLDYLNSELRSNDLLDIIDDKTPHPLNLEMHDLEKRKSLVRDIIINHLDEYYHKKILNVKDPKVIISKIKEFRNVESNVTASSVRARLYRIKMHNREKVNEFSDRFDAIIREYESCDTGVPLTEEKKRSAFYHAVSNNYPELRSASLIRRQAENKDMSLDEIKSFLLQLEAENKNLEEPKRAPRANIAQRPTEGHAEGHNRCYRCNRTGHVSSACPLAEYKLWFCYICQGELNHKGTGCPNKGAAASQNWFVNNDQHKNNTTHNNTTQFKGNNKSRGRGFSNRGGGITIRGGGRGNFRGRVFKRRANWGGRGGSNNALEQGARAYVAGINICKINIPTQTQITFIAHSGATDHIVNKGIILSEFRQCTGEVINSQIEYK